MAQVMEADPGQAGFLQQWLEGPPPDPAFAMQASLSVAED